MSTLTPEQQNAIRTTLAAMPHLSVGVGNAHAACSVAAINLALRGELTDAIPDCMSLVIGRWIISVQDRMPSQIRDSDEWRDLLPLAAGTGRDPIAECTRLDVIMAWMWDGIARLQPQADASGYGNAWRTMIEERTPEAADQAADQAATVASAGASAGTAWASEAARAAASALAEARASRSAARAARAALAAEAAERAARAVARAAAEAEKRTPEAAEEAAWDDMAPTELLRKLVQIEWQTFPEGGE